MLSIDINCDLGEGMLTDASLMPYISSANIACGKHAGNIETMHTTVALAQKHNVAIGAHPGFDDAVNFGRTEMVLSETDLYNLVALQIRQMLTVCKNLNATLHHVKPHGALYNMAAKNKEMARVIATAVRDLNENLILYGLSGSYLVSEAKRIGLRTANEVFADRTYQEDGTLTSRKEKNALIETDYAAIDQALKMIAYKTVTTLSGKEIPIQSDTVCIHGDGAHAVAFAKNIYHTLKSKNIVLQAV